MRSAVTLLATAVAVATLAGCTVGPDYEKPQQVANVALAGLSLQIPPCLRLSLPQ